jgi:hypothetical protein
MSRMKGIKFTIASKEARKMWKAVKELKELKRQNYIKAHAMSNTEVNKNE